MFTLVSRLIGQGGLLGVFVLMVIENIFPLLPSELILPMAGFEAAAGKFDPLLAILAGGVGSTVGALSWYLLGRRVGVERLADWAGRHGRWLTLTPAEVYRAHAWLQRFGPVALCIGRALPGVRGVICIPAGFSGMRLRPFLIWCLLGSLIWSALLTGAGYLLRSQFVDVERWLNPITVAFALLCLLVYAWRVATFPAHPKVARRADTSDVRRLRRR